MKSGKLGLVLGLGILLGAFAANASTITDLDNSSSEYLGSVTKATPSNPVHEVAYINELLRLLPGETNPDFGHPSNVLTRSINPFTGLPVATEEGSVKTEINPDGQGTLSITLSGWTYLYAKYGSGGDDVGALVWYVKGLEEVTIPFPKLSHWSVYNPTTSVPDGGTTVMLLGAALIGLGAIRRKIR